MKIAKLYLILIVLVFGGLTQPAFAQTNDDPKPDSVTQNPKPDITVTTPSIRLINPLAGNKDIKSLPDLVNSILRIVLTVGTPIIALAIIYSGFLFVAAQGDPTKLTKAKNTLLYVLIGAGILLASYVIAEAIVGTVNAIRGQ